MKQISVEDIRIMRFRYRHDADLVSVINELLEYREAEEQAGGDPTEPTKIAIVPRTELERECGSRDPLQWREH